MKILVCGGRKYCNYKVLEQTLNNIKPTSVVHGAASGADTLADMWCQENKVTIHAHPAKWNQHGKSAGPIRNAEMLEAHPDIELVVAFKGGRGTANMLKLAKQKEIAIHEVAD